MCAPRAVTHTEALITCHCTVYFWIDRHLHHWISVLFVCWHSLISLYTSPCSKEDASCMRVIDEVVAHVENAVLVRVVRALITDVQCS